MSAYAHIHNIYRLNERRMFVKLAESATQAKACYTAWGQNIGLHCVSKNIPDTYDCNL